MTSLQILSLNELKRLAARKRKIRHDGKFILKQRLYVVRYKCGPFYSCKWLTLISTLWSWQLQGMGPLIWLTRWATQCKIKVYVRYCIAKRLQQMTQILVYQYFHTCIQILSYLHTNTFIFVYKYLSLKLGSLNILVSPLWVIYSVGNCSISIKTFLKEI